MKKIKLFNQFIAVFIAIGFTGCSDSSDSTEIPSNTELKVLEHSYDYFNYGSGKVDLKYFNVNKTINAQSLVLESNFDQMKNDILNSFGIEAKNSSEISHIILFGKNLNLNIKKQDITGLSILKNIDGNFFMETYKLDASKAILVQNFTKNYKKIIIKDLFGYISNEINKTNTSYFLINNQIAQKNIKPKNGEEDPDYSLDLYLLEQYPIIYTPALARGHNCEMNDCNSEDTGFCGIHSDNHPAQCEESSYVEDQWCARDEDEETPGEDEEEEDPDYTLVAKSAMYSIRDNILSSSTKGQQYIDFYYKLGYVWKVTNAYVNYKSDISAVMDFIDRKSILFVTASSSTVIIDSTEATFLRSKINILKNIHTNAEYQYIFTTLELDLNTLENKTKSDILSLL